MLSDKFLPDTSDQHGSGRPRIRTAVSRHFGTKWKNVPIASYELETRNPSRLVFLTILRCYQTSFVRTQVAGMVPACQEFGPQNHVVLALNGSTYLVTSSELETRNPSRSVLLSIQQCYPKSFLWTQANGTVPACRESERRIAPFWHEMGARILSLRMSSKPEILRGRYSSAYYNALRLV